MIARMLAQAVLATAILLALGIVGAGDTLRLRPSPGTGPDLTWRGQP